MDSQAWRWEKEDDDGAAPSQWRRRRWRRRRRWSPWWSLPLSPDQIGSAKFPWILVGGLAGAAISREQ
ncbi:unnamed protein product [Spirodela intermedia]|uniref:Uncharacterized protein n=1 Tax=Spirodela intermedia TaxID=51605 RepID=A0A7I8JAK7_SPIIN|nr:unnamed protein product [Spirodela intermedia]CAA6667197.1 unnamed protein product [Spirodela intermedia]